jgi:hypothetical protein
MSKVKLNRETGLTDDDSFGIKVFMLSLNDAVRCSNEIA